MDVKNFSRNLKNIRESLGYTQKEFAKVLGTSQQAYSKWEIGKTSPTLNRVGKIIFTLNISLEELFE